jgi:hypothetical protein
MSVKLADNFQIREHFMAMPVSIDGKSIFTLYSATVLDNVDCASLALHVAPVSYCCLKKNDWTLSQVR